MKLKIKNKLTVEHLGGYTTFYNYQKNVFL